MVQDYSEAFNFFNTVKYDKIYLCDKSDNTIYDNMDDNDDTLTKTDKRITNKHINMKNLTENVFRHIVNDIKNIVEDHKYQFNQNEIYNIIKHANDYLISTRRLIGLDVYLKAFRNVFNPDIEIEYNDLSMKLLCSKKFFPIHHSELKTYEICMDINDSNVTCSRAKQLINTHKFIEDVEYIKINDESKDKYSLRDYTNYTNCTSRTSYYFSFDAFLLMLMRSRNTSKYAKYFILIYKVFHYYQDYICSAQKVIMEKESIAFTSYEKETDLRIKELTELNKVLKSRYQEITEEVLELEDSNDTLKNINSRFEEEYEENEELNIELKEKNKLIETLNITLKKKDKEIEKLELEIEMLEDEVTELKDYIDELEEDEE